MCKQFLSILKKIFIGIFKSIEIATPFYKMQKISVRPTGKQVLTSYCT